MDFLRLARRKPIRKRHLVCPEVFAGRNTGFGKFEALVFAFAFRPIR